MIMVVFSWNKNSEIPKRLPESGDAILFKVSVIRRFSPNFCLYGVNNAQFFCFLLKIPGEMPTTAASRGRNNVENVRVYIKCAILFGIQSLRMKGPRLWLLEVTTTYSPISWGLTIWYENGGIVLCT